MGGRFPKKQVKGADRRVSEMYIFTQFYQQTFNVPIVFTTKVDCLSFISTNHLMSFICQSLL